MRALSATALLVTALVGLTTAASASAAAPEPISIDFAVTVFTPTTFSGTWTSSGVIVDSGTFDRTDVNFTGSLAHSPVVGTFQSTLHLASSLGTFTVEEQLRFTLTDVLGTWEIKSGRGAYTSITGHGTFEFISPVHFVDSGVASKTG